MEIVRPVAIVIKETDNVATAISELMAGERVKVRVGGEEREVELKNDIRFLHKFAVEDIEKGQHVRKYGESIGEATSRIQRGEHVHTHNLRSLRGCSSG